MKLSVFLPSWIGDVVMATPALQALRRHFREAYLLGVLKPYVAGVLQGSAWLDDHVFLDKRGPWANRWPAVAARLRRDKIDLAVLFPNSFRSALVAWLGGCRQRAGYVRYGRRWLLTDRLPPIWDAAGRLLPSPIIDAYNRLAEHVGCLKYGGNRAPKIARLVVSRHDHRQRAPRGCLVAHSGAF